MKFVKGELLRSVALLVTVVSSAPPPAWSSQAIIPPAVANASSHSTLTSGFYGFDAPKISPINSTSWDWWYFDVVSEDAQSSAVVVFYTAPETGFIFAQAPEDSILEASLQLKIPGYEETLSIANFAQKATVVSAKNGASGDWAGAGFSFVGSPDMKEYVVSIDDQKLGIKGLITFTSASIPLS